MRLQTKMTERKPDFWLASGEHPKLRVPRACWFIKRLKTQYSDDWMLITVHPPISGTDFGFGEHDIDTVMISPRHYGRTLFPINEWPLLVFVARLLINPQNIQNNMVSESEYIRDFWCELYKTQGVAMDAMKFWDAIPKENFLETCDTKTISNLDAETVKSPLEESKKTCGTKWMKFWIYVFLPAFTLFFAFGQTTLIIKLNIPYKALIYTSHVTILLLSAIYGMHKRYLFAWWGNIFWVVLLFLNVLRKILIYDKTMGIVEQLTAVSIIIFLIMAHIIYWHNRKDLFISTDTFRQKTVFAIFGFSLLCIVFWFIWSALQRSVI